MSNPPKARGGWGSLLSGAVAGLESKLDVILADDQHASANQRAAEKDKKDKVQAAKAVPKNKANDRLQARLAQALANKSGSETGSKAGSERSSVDLGSRPSTPVVKTDTTPRESIDIQKNESQVAIGEEAVSQQTGIASKIENEQAEVEPKPVIGTEAIAQVEEPTLAPQTTTATPLPPVEDALQSFDDSLEQIDALHAKIAYLSDQLQEYATRAAREASSGSTEKRLADQDLKIAQLMQEGQTLSRKELRFSQAVKTLRSRVQEGDKLSADHRAKAEKLELTNQQLQDQVKNLQIREKSANARLLRIATLEKDLSNVHTEKKEALNEIQHVMTQRDAAERRADEAVKKAQANKVEEHSRVISDLQDEVSNSKIEKKLLEDRLRNEMKDVKEAHAMQLDKHKLTEMELKTELQNMESKLEALRLRSEEDFSSTTSDAQTKLLRQIETLQSQYALASENWQGIETSLNTRILTLEKERDDLAKREADVRKKARETTSKARRLEEELESARDQSSTLESTIVNLRSSQSRLEAKIAAAEKASQFAKDELEQTRKELEASFKAQLEEERNRMRTELSQPLSPTAPLETNSFLRTDSYPSYPTRKASGPEFIGSQRRNSARPPNNDLASLFPTHSPETSRPSTSKRGSVRPGPLRMPTDPSISSRPESASPSFSNNYGLTTPSSAFPSETPSIHTIDVDEHDDEFPNRDSPQRTVADLISVSTAGAGPSVQLVERMSATVRKLEMEKAATREELARLQSQRDEAREEVVTMMRDMEGLKSDNAKVEAIQHQVDDLQKRHDAALELLGEKSEECEELKNDVIDLKKIYRELVESTMR